MILGIDGSQANRKTRSGTEWYAFYIIREFKKLLGGRSDVRVRLYVRDLPQADLTSGLPENFEVKILRWPLRYLWVQARLSLEMLLHPPDILFCPAHTVPLTSLLSPAYRTGRRGGRGRTRVFTTLHDVGFEDYPELYDKLSLWYHRFSAWLAVKKAHHIFTSSEFSRERIIANYDCPPEKLTAIHLGIDPDFLIKRKVSRGNYLLYVGRLEPKKNILNLVKAYEMAEVPQDLILAGQKIRTGDVDEYLAARPALAAKVKFLGHVTEERKKQLYAAAALFLFPTLYEGFGLPILEAQAAGIPVITSSTASHPEVAGKGALIVDPENVPAISGAIQRILNDQQLRAELAAEGFKNLDRFSWSKTAEEILKTMLTP